ncbi:myosin-8 isoform 2 [Planoprotostelium fungivorum]|uniref:Myosin-8 isoform 2 n=1 Tax=Planoprotostelium fungivorum TaxID=1890364 RepID=A0A2P6MXX0_9EUKA|nr:myosin-8 isoform 2 [Planoprotostelium fungivorum]
MSNKSRGALSPGNRGSMDVFRKSLDIPTDLSDAQVWEQAYKQLEEELANKEQEVAMVAELGKSLLEKNQEMEGQIITLIEKDNQNTMVIQELEHNLAEAKSKRKQEKSDEPTFDANYLQQEYRLQQERNEQLMHTLNQLQLNHEDLQQQMKKKDKQAQSEVAELKKSLSHFEEESHKHQKSLELMLTRDNEYKRQTSLLEAEKNNLSEQCAALDQKLQSLTKNYNELKRKFKEKEYETNEARDQLELYKEEMKGYGDNIHNLQTTVATLVKQNSQLQVENQELSDHLREQREMQMGDQRNLPEHISSMDATDSLFAELAQSIGTRKQDVVSAPAQDAAPLIDLQPDVLSTTTSQNVTTNPLTDSPPITNSQSTTSLVPASPAAKDNGNLRVIGQVKKNPLESDHHMVDPGATMSEFFFTAAAAVKINLFIAYPDKAIQLQEVDLKKMYETAMKENIEFHQWYPWIQDQFNQRVISVNRSSAPATPRGGQSESSKNVPQPTPLKMTKSAETPKKVVALPPQQTQTTSSQDGAAYNELERKANNNGFSFCPPNTSPIPVTFLEEDDSDRHKPYAAFVHKYQDQNTAMHKIFSFMKPSEFLIEFYSNCMMDNIKGNLYVTEHGIYFHALRQTPTQDLRIKLLYNDIKNILKPFGLFVWSRDIFHVETKKNTRFVLGGFASLDGTFEIVKKLFQTHSTENSDD